MRFNNIYIEKDLKQHPEYSKKLSDILQKVEGNHLEINKIEDVFGRVKVPYLQKRESLNLFIGRKMGNLVKPAPPAYGTKTEDHYYFIHAYNCIYECQYCYLQGYFNSPDIVLFINHDEICTEIETIGKNNPDKKIWFHAGEFSDSLALSHITNELSYYWQCFEKNPNLFLELRTKSVNIKTILQQKVLKNIVTSFSLSSTSAAKEFDLKTPGLKARLAAIGQLASLGYPIGIHLDPIVYQNTIFEDYDYLLQELAKVLPDSLLQYMSLGVVRFTRDVYSEMESNYPDSKMLKSSFIKSTDNKVRYPRPMRFHILNEIKKMAVKHSFTAEKIYLCMEEEDA